MSFLSTHAAASPAATDLYEYGGGSVIACAVVFIVACTFILALRFYAHWVDRRPNNMEDWILIPAWLLMMGLCVNVILSVTLGGVGRHETYVLEFEPQVLTPWAQMLLVVELIYGPVIALEKTSILLFYRRIFHISRWFRLTTLAMIVYVWLWAASEWFTAIFQCNPVPKQWDQTLDGTCIDRLAFYRWICLPNVLHDLAMLALPAPMVWNLQMAFRQKAALSTIFLLGSFGCVASFIRMSRFFQLDAFSDNTWASIQLMAWTVAEPGVILICACLPALRPLLQRLIPSVFHSMRSGREKGSAGSAGLGASHGGGGVLSSAGGRGRGVSYHDGGIHHDPSRAFAPVHVPTGHDFVPLVDYPEPGARAVHYADDGAPGGMYPPGRSGIHVSTKYGWAVEDRPATSTMGAAAQEPWAP